MNRPSLKHCSVHLKHHWLQDLPIPFDKDVDEKTIEKIIKYNRNDVNILRKIYMLEKVKEAIDMRKNLGFIYGVDFLLGIQRLQM